eukprot:CAMPEP_0119273794 /NCGR_PEP_ID=MMETSP1329-20130426/10960_1 /TAXON_ID=114041 /ORGANISM="Genus nov. species nov., Strain RCC1024" /LENGTH=30 /DNA_ID= /DNA_START= /DNA_END= /DNA_ORIENTATION=
MCVPLPETDTSVAQDTSVGSQGPQPLASEH